MYVLIETFETLPGSPSPGTLSVLVSRHDLSQHLIRLFLGRHTGGGTCGSHAEVGHGGSCKFHGNPLENGGFNGNNVGNITIVIVYLWE